MNPLKRLVRQEEDFGQESQGLFEEVASELSSKGQEGGSGAESHLAKNIPKSQGRGAVNAKKGLMQN